MKTEEEKTPSGSQRTNSEGSKKETNNIVHVVAPDVKLLLSGNECQIRPGIFNKTTIDDAGIRHLNADEAIALFGLRAPGLIIPYVDEDGNPLNDSLGKFSGRLRLDEPMSDMKYFQPKGTSSHLYIPPQFRTLVRNTGSFSLHEGEFKSLADSEAGNAAVGFSGFYGFQIKDDNGNSILHPELVKLIERHKPTDIYFWGDNDTASNWQFCDAACSLKKLLDPFDITLHLPRIQLDGPKGIDDCKEQYKDKFADWRAGLVASAVTIDNSMAVEDLILELFESEVDHFKALKGEFRQKIDRHLVNTFIRLEESPSCMEKFKKLIVKSGMGWSAFKKLVGKRKEQLAREYAEKQKDDLEQRAATPAHGENPLIILSGSGKLISEFGAELAGKLVQDNKFFNYNEMLVHINELERLDYNNEVHSIIGFSPVTPPGFIVDIEQHVTPVMLVKEKAVKCSLGKLTAEALIKSDFFLGKFLRIDGISEINLPYIMDDELRFTQHGYNPDLKIYVLGDAPVVDPMSLDSVFETLLDNIGEFCYLDIVDFVRAVAYLITPLVRLITNGSRSMIFLADANRQGAGKDCLLGMAPLICSGKEPCFYPPCENDEEWRKRIFSALLGGERFVMISNQKGHLSSGALEHTLTSSYISDRVLGQSKNLTLPNSAIYSISGNGLTFSDDMARRICHIRLEFYQEEQANRKFKYPDLYAHVLQQRTKLLSALMSMIVHWAACGCPKGRSIPSFVKWSETVCGILTCCGFPDPFAERGLTTPGLEIGGSREDKDFKQLIELFAEKFSNAQVDALQLRLISTENNLFGWMDLALRPGQVWFSRMLSQRAKRVIVGWRLFVNTAGKTNKFYLEKVK